MEPQTFWRGLSDTSRARLIVGIVMLVAIVVAVIETYCHQLYG